MQKSHTVHKKNHSVGFWRHQRISIARDDVASELKIW